MGTTPDNNDQQCNGGGEETLSTKECTSSEQNNIDDITKGIDSVAVLDMSTCANCGKEGNSDDMNTCNKCKEMKYCNAACKKKHRSKHKKKCDRRVAELHDEALLKEPPLPEECPICMLPLPSAEYTTVGSCCGKRICNGCVYAMHMSEGKDLCAFCRLPPPSSDEEEIERTKNLVDKGNVEAIHLLASYYREGIMGMQQNLQKANKLYIQAGELGYAAAYYNLGLAYYHGRGEEVDKKKAKYYWELAAMGGSAQARHNVGWEEVEAENEQRAVKHFIIAARAGFERSLAVVKEGFKRGLIMKDEYESTLRAYQKRQNEMKSDERDKAAIYYGNV